MEPNRPTNTPEEPNQDAPQPVGGSTPPKPQTPPAADTVPNGPVFDTVPSEQPVTPTPPPAVDTTPLPQPVQTPPEGNRRPLGLLLIGLVVLLVVFLGILFFFVFNKPVEENTPVQQVPVQDLQPSPTSSVTPTPELTEDGVDSINIGSPEAALSPVESEIDQLQ